MGEKSIIIVHNSGLNMYHYRNLRYSKSSSRSSEFSCFCASASIALPSTHHPLSYGPFIQQTASSTVSILSRWPIPLEWLAVCLKRFASPAMHIEGGGAVDKIKLLSILEAFGTLNASLVQFSIERESEDIWTHHGAWSWANFPYMLLCL